MTPTAGVDLGQPIAVAFTADRLFGQEPIDDARRRHGLRMAARALHSGVLPMVEVQWELLGRIHHPARPQEHDDPEKAAHHQLSATSWPITRTR